MKKWRVMMVKRKLKGRKKQLFLCLSLFVVIGSCLAMLLFQENEQKIKEVSAHPTSTIGLGNGAQSFTVPTDSPTPPREPDLNAAYGSYYQGTDGPIPVLRKYYVESYGSNGAIDYLGGMKTVEWMVRDVQETAGGNYIVLFGSQATNIGGVTLVGLYSRSGKLLDRISWVGPPGEKTEKMDLSTSHYRVNTKFLSGNNKKEFLVGTDKEALIKYTVSNETPNPEAASLTMSEIKGVRKLDSEGKEEISKPKDTLGVNYYYRVDTFSNFNISPLIAGAVYFTADNKLNASPKAKFRVPLGTLNVNGWTDNSPSVSLNTYYDYSLETVIPIDGYPGGSEPGGTRQYGHLTPIDVYRRNKKIFGQFNYAKTGTRGTVGHTVQIFDSEDRFNEGGGSVARRKYIYPPVRTSANGLAPSIDNNYEILILRELCTDNEIYFFSKEETKSKLIKVDLTNYQEEVMKEFPKDTRLNILKNPNNSSPEDPSKKWFYFGSTPALTDYFEHSILSSRLPGPAEKVSYFVQGVMDKDFNRKSVYAIDTNGPVIPHFMKPGNDRVLIFGQVEKYNLKFVNDYHRIELNGTVTEKESPSSTRRFAFVGSSDVFDDYPPLINVDKTKAVRINIDDTDLNKTEKNSQEWTVLENWLITGEKSGTLNGAKSIKVYDTIDSNDTIVFGQEWLNKFIDRNPKNTTADIEVEKLGYKKNLRGPQLVTYFVSDSEFQPSSISRVVNNFTDQTVSEGEYELDALNFHIPLEGIGTHIPDADTFKKLAKTLAWNNITGDIDEDSIGESGPAKLSGKVEVNDAQLQVVRNLANKKENAKPFPVDVTYKPGGGNPDIVNRVWVFPTTKNTVPNAEAKPDVVTPEQANGVVYYAEDYSMPLIMAKHHTKQNVLDRGNVRVYDYYDSTHETDSTLPTLADKVKNKEKLELTNLPVIKDATEVGTVRPIFKYKWQSATDKYHDSTKYTYGGLDVTLTGEVRFNIRQIILDAHDDLVVPKEGYMKLNNTNAKSQHVFNAVTNSGKYTGLLTTEPEFKAYEFVLNLNNKKLGVYPVIPEYYQYYGYVATNTKVNHLQSDIVSAHYEYNLDPNTEVYEKWLTIYLVPITSNSNEKIKPYSWDYKLNDFGSIKVE